ncbi:MAG: peptidoglycan DD-metalloendopeptidase family protein [Fibrobacterota bacterium]
MIKGHRVKSGDTFSSILAGFGLPGENAIAFYRSLSDLGLTGLFPGDSFVVATDQDSRLLSLSILSKFRHWYHLKLDSTSFTARKQPLPTVRHTCVVKGRLESSLSEDLYRYGVGDALVGKLAEIFAWDINFFMDPRKGDRFKVLFEKLYRSGCFVGYGNILAAEYSTNKRDYHAIAMEDSIGRLNYFDVDGRSVRKKFLKAPLRFNRISSGFTHNRRHPVLGIVRPHLGIDYAAPTGTRVYASARGRVSFAGAIDGYGNHVRIAHDGAYETYYGHLHRIAQGIRTGVEVQQGQLIGTVGSTGLSTGPHLDYRMKRGSQFVNPMSISLPSMDAVSEQDRERFDRIKHASLTILDQRFKQDGCFVVTIKTPPTPEMVEFVHTLKPENAHGDREESSEDTKRNHRLQPRSAL